MNKMKWTFTTFAACMVLFACATASQAVPRTFIAGTGSDANAPACSFTLPCRFLNTAYANTDIGGEIVALTPAGYGGLAITHAITVQAIPGQVGFISVVASSAGITVSAGASETVVIRNFQFSGSPALAANSIGIQHNSGKLVVEGCSFTQLTTGLRATAGSIIVRDSSFTGNSSKGVHVSGTAKADLVGILIANNATGVTGDGDCANTLVRIDSGSVVNNTLGLEMLNAGPTCPPVSGSGNKNIFLRFDGGIHRVNVIGNTTVVGPSPGAGQQAQVGTYQSLVITQY